MRGKASASSSAASQCAVHDLTKPELAKSFAGMEPRARSTEQRAEPAVKGRASEVSDRRLAVGNLSHEPDLARILAAPIPPRGNFHVLIILKTST